MVAISPTNSTALALLQQTQRHEPRNPQSFFNSGAFAGVGAGDTVGAEVLAVFAGNEDLQRQFVEEYDRIRKEHSGMTDANAAHNAAVEVITKNRGSFPAGGFTIHTDLPGGGSITTLIQPTSGPRLSFAITESVAIKRAAAEAAKADLDKAATAGEIHDAREQAPNIRDRIAALFR